ncbi:uncharacterized protein SPAPADRAFT_64959 [Spathaspora passalidarum NRRL Y-27907]|uniref:Extracellular membrane protein CFEM domain-containing protein n=1 Tax=Spathaspora passalidarum (strain NRRL Y-27907 / 11-Y1) TaxID=619300 RepID=G3AIL2_SPAPN|nr:uncharacterized protein SPAPADRAFT_64959 [Spathaspora passalidarum NRRL Y-27907]EGW33727.1 hypothetical protein SPAPADRAFT_64959 [Spathaspora passalidarum NRRL Y-27907]
MKLSILYYVAFTAAYIQKRDSDLCIADCVMKVEAKSPKCISFFKDIVAMKKCICAQDSTYWNPLVECVADCPGYADEAEAGASIMKASFCAANAQVEPIADDEKAASTSSKTSSSTSSKTSSSSSSKTSSATSSKTSSATSSTSGTTSGTGSKTTGSQTSSGSTTSSTSTKSTTSHITNKGSAAETKIDSLMGLLMLALF